MRDLKFEVAGVRAIELEHAVVLLVVMAKKTERNDNATANPTPKRTIPEYMRGCGCGFGYTDDEDSTIADDE